MVAVPLLPGIRFGVLYCRQRSFFLYCDLRLWFRGCPVVLDIELSVSTRYHQTHVLQRVRRFVLQLVAAGGGVRHKSEN